MFVMKQYTNNKSTETENKENYEIIFSLLFFFTCFLVNVIFFEII